MKKTLIILSLFIGTIALAQSIDYPVAELGNCQDKEDCRQYCDVLSNTEDCLNFAETHQLFTTVELQEARKVVNALKQGAQTPGNCQNKTECDVYCNQRDHIRECFNFAKKAGLIPSEELEQAEKSIPLIEAGESPGGCVTKEECDAYCSKDENKEECMNFAIKAGLMSQEEAERYKKTGGKGPGGCQSREECDAFCNDPANQQTCFEFGREHGLISQKEINMIQEETQKMQDALYSASPEVLNCLTEKLGTDVVEKLKSGNFLPSSKIGESTRECFEKYQKGEEDNERLRQVQEALQSAPPEVVNCLNQRLGSDVVEDLKSGIAPSGPDAGEAVRTCFEQYYAKQQQLEQQQQGGYAPGTAPGEQPIPPESEMGPPPEGEMMPPEGEMGPPPEGEMPSKEEMVPQKPPEGGQVPPKGEMTPPEGEMGPPEVEGE